MEEKTKTVETWIEEKKIEPMIAAAARAFHRWPIGLELEEEKFDDAIAEATKATSLGARSDREDETKTDTEDDTAPRAGKE